MSCTRTVASTLAASLLLAAPAWAQAEGDAPAAPDPAALLKVALGKMPGIGSIAFRTTETQDAAMTRRIQRQVGGMLGGGGAVEVRGAWSAGVLRASMNGDADEIISYRGRQIARNDDVSWKLRRGNLASGQAMPFVLDPGHFFEALAALPKPALRVLHHEASTYQDRPVMILSLTLEDEDAQDFALSGALPSVGTGMGGAIRVMGMGAAPGAGAMPELTVDLALYVDTETGMVHRIRSHTYQRSTMPGNVRIQIGGGGGGFGGDQGEEEEKKEEVKERDKDGKRIYKRGLPVRKLGDELSLASFDIVLSKHGQAPIGEISGDARQLLRLPAATGGDKK